MKNLTDKKRGEILNSILKVIRCLLADEEKKCRQCKDVTRCFHVGNAVNTFFTKG